MRFVSFQTNFSTGELDPLLRARVDIDQYPNALAKATNVLIQPQGGMRRRPGTKHIHELPTTSTPSAANGVRLVNFEFSVADSYILVFTHQRMYVIKNGVVITAINGGADNYLTTSITGAMLDQLCWTQSADTVILVHPDLAPQKLQRGASDAAWTISTITFDSIPSYAFSQRVFEPQGTLTPSSTTGKVTLTASQAEVTGTAQAGAGSTITLAAGASGTANFYNGLFIEITSGTGSGQVRQIIAYNNSTKVATVDSAWATTPDNTSVYSIAVFKSAAVGQYVNAEPQGRARIIAVTSNTVAQAVIEYPFFNNSAIANGKWELEAGYEPVWSAARGYPRTVTFHEGRLYFGGSKTRPSTIWGSKVNIFFDFSPVEALDDDAVEATLDTNALNVIVDMLSGRDLQVFTTGGEFYVAQPGTDPITPTSLNFKQVSRNGARLGTRVETIETGTVFVQRQGKSLNEFLFSDQQLTYVTSRISLLAGHLLKGPKRMALRRGTSTDEGDLLLVTNDDDGSMACFSILRSQNVVAPSEFTTDGEFIDVQTDVQDIYVVVEREFNEATRYFVERFREDLFTDCAFIGTNASGATSLPHEGKALNVICDGVPQSNETVATGAITFDRPSTASFEVGLPFTVFAKTLPAELKLQTGTRTGFKKRIVQVSAIVNDTQHLRINGQLVPFRNFDTVDTLDAPVPEFTGVKRLDGVLGYSREAAIEIEQVLPLKMTLLGLEFKVAVHPGT